MSTSDSVATMNRAVTVRIDPARCTGCGQCVEVCPAETLSLRGGKAVVSGSRSLNCGHCAAVCSANAVTVGALDPAASAFVRLPPCDEYSPPGAGDLAALVRVMRSRRSCRKYQARAVARAVLEDLARSGATAPSGTNSQKWTYTVLAERPAVTELGRRVGALFHKLNRQARNPVVRLGARLLGNAALDRYYREHLVAVEKALTEWETQGRDRTLPRRTRADSGRRQAGRQHPAG